MKKIPIEKIIDLVALALLCVAVAILFSCNTYTCPTNSGREPRDKTKRMRVQYKKINDSLFFVREEKGFEVKTYYTTCQPCKL